MILSRKLFSTSIFIVFMISCSSYNYTLKNRKEVCFNYNPKIINELSADYEYMFPMDTVKVEKMERVIDSIYLSKNISLSKKDACVFEISIDSIINSEFTSYSSNISGFGTPRLNDAQIKIYSTIVNRYNNTKKKVVGKGGISTYEDQRILLPFLNVERNTNYTQDLMTLDAVIDMAFKSARFIKKQSK